jgi:hypothetical protein
MTTHGVSLATLAAAGLLLACEPDRAPFSPSERLDAAARKTGTVFLSPNAAGQMGTVSTTGPLTAATRSSRASAPTGGPAGAATFRPTRSA